jgi:hypothetical protein
LAISSITNTSGPETPCNILVENARTCIVESAGSVDQIDEDSKVPPGNLGTTSNDLLSVEVVLEGLSMPSGSPT